MQIKGRKPGQCCKCIQVLLNVVEILLVWWYSIQVANWVEFWVTLSTKTKSVVGHCNFSSWWNCTTPFMCMYITMIRYLCRSMYIVIILTYSTKCTQSSPPHRHSTMILCIFTLTVQMWDNYLHFYRDCIPQSPIKSRARQSKRISFIALHFSDQFKNH